MKLTTSIFNAILQKRLAQSVTSTTVRCFGSKSRLEPFQSSDLQLQTHRKIKSIPHHSTLKFGQVMTDHMFEVYWESERGWGKPVIDHYHPLNIDPAAKCLHYSLELFEGMKAYCGVDNKIRLFRPSENFKRMNFSAERCCLPTVDVEQMTKCLHKYVEVEKDWVPQAEGCSLYLRPTMIGLEPSLGVASSKEALLFVIASPVGPYFPSGMKPVSLLADPAFVRAWPGGAGNSKLGSNYGPTVFIQNKALQQGCQQVLWLFGDNHRMTEAGTMNIFIHLKNKNGESELVTPPLDSGVILPGVVRKSILELAKGWGDIKVSEREITMEEVCNAANEGTLMEIFGSGTACVVCPVERIHYQNKDISIPTMKTENALYAKLYKELNDIYYGRTESPWAEYVCDA